MLHLCRNAIRLSMSGDKLSSYGGNLTLDQDGEGRGERVKTSSAILTGNRMSLHYIRDLGATAETRISLAEKDWVRIENGAPVPATREDMLRVLSDIQVSHLSLFIFSRALGMPMSVCLSVSSS